MSTYNQSRHSQSGGRPHDEHRSDREGRFTPISTENLSKIIVDGDAAMMVKEADGLGNRLAKKDNLSTSQIRAIFGEVRRIQGLLSVKETNEDGDNVQKQKEKALHKLYLLKPKMAYRKEKEKGHGVKNLVAVLDPALELVFTDNSKREERFVHFVEFFEAILAYHRAYGGK